MHRDQTAFGPNLHIAGGGGASYDVVFHDGGAEVAAHIRRARDAGLKPGLKPVHSQQNQL